ncbi:MAG TPA: hypothetical protein VMI72_10685 [Roseiarcus sp.]|nr:hypothetical protein [Roseiarcus sp.]
MSGSPGKALEQIEFAAKHDPNAAKSLNYYRGWALRVLGKPEDSLTAYKQPDMSWHTPINIAIDLVRIDEAKAQVMSYLEKSDPKFTHAKWRQPPPATASASNPFGISTRERRGRRR